MTIIEQIKAEIERRKGYISVTHFAEELLSFLSTLESEKPLGEEYAIEIGKYTHTLRIGSQSDIDNLIRQEKQEQPGVEEEISRYLREECSGDDEPSISEIARHFAKWGAEHFRDTTKNMEPPCHTVEEWIEHIKNADQLTKDIFSKGPYNVLYDALNRPYRDCYDAIKEFGELCYQTARQDMLKEAVEADVMLTLHDKTGDISLHTGYLPKELGIKCDDKVRVIIVKED